MFDMKQVALLFMIASSCVLLSCSGGKKKSDNALTTPDTAIVVYGQETVTPVDSDSVMVSVADTAAVIIVDPAQQGKTQKSSDKKKK